MPPTGQLRRPISEWKNTSTSLAVPGQMNPPGLDNRPLVSAHATPCPLVNSHEVVDVTFMKACASLDIGRASGQRLSASCDHGQCNERSEVHRWSPTRECVCLTVSEPRRKVRESNANGLAPGAERASTARFSSIVNYWFSVCSVDISPALEVAYLKLRDRVIKGHFVALPPS